MKAKGKKIVMVLGIVVCIVGLWMVYSQLTAKTPPILNEKGEKVEGSIAELIAINVNGHKEWLSIRGCDENAPVLLFLAGGPGGTQLAATRFELSELEKQGTPLYYEGNIALLSANYLNVLSNEMARNPEIHNGGYQTFRDMFADEYGIVDSVHFMLGVMNTFNVVYPQLYDVDLIETYHSLEVPMYFFLGKHDINAPVELAVDYYEKLSCPHKELVWFEHSGHNPWMNESDKFVEETVRVFLK